MKKLIYSTLIIAITIIFALGLSFAEDVWVNGYYKSNGTYVDGHYRTAPNSTKSDNYSTYPNVNPYTGERGTRKSYDSDNNSYSNPYGNSYKKGRSSSYNSLYGD